MVPQLNLHVIQCQFSMCVGAVLGAIMLGGLLAPWGSFGIATHGLLVLSIRRLLYLTGWYQDWYIGHATSRRLV